MSLIFGICELSFRKQCEGHHRSDRGQLATRVEECAVTLKVQGGAASPDPWILHLPAQGILKDDFPEHLPLGLCHLQMILMKESHHLLQTVVMLFLKSSEDAFYYICVAFLSIILKESTLTRCDCQQHCFSIQYASTSG